MFVKIPKKPNRVTVISKCFNRDLKMRGRRQQVKRRLKMFSRFSNRHRDCSITLTLSNVHELSWSWIPKNLIQVKKERKFRRCLSVLMTSSIKHEIRHFHVVVVQNVKKCTKTCFARAKLFFSCCFSYFNNLLVLKTYRFYDVHVAVAVVWS